MLKAEQVIPFLEGRYTVQQARAPLLAGFCMCVYNRHTCTAGCCSLVHACSLWGATHAGGHRQCMPCTGGLCRPRLQHTMRPLCHLANAACTMPLQTTCSPLRMLACKCNQRSAGARGDEGKGQAGHRD